MSTLVERSATAADLRRLVSDGDLPDDVVLVYEFGDSDSLHVWLISKEFASVSQRRHSRIYNQLRKHLPLHTLLRITLLILQTGAEFERVYTRKPEEFAEPPAAGDGEGPYRLTRAA